MTAVETAAPAERRRLRRLARWAEPRLKTGLFWMFVALFSLPVAGYAIWLLGMGAVKATEGAISTGSNTLEFATVIVFMAVTGAGLRWAFARHRLLPRQSSTRLEPLLRIGVVVAFAVASFASLTAVLYHEDALAVRGPAVRDENVIGKSAEFYVWHLADSVPLLDITDNLRWDAPFETDDVVGGLLLIVFTGVVILPLFPAIRLAAAPPERRYAGVVLDALEKDLTGSAGPPRPRAAGVIQHRGLLIRVDAVRELWTEDATLRRLPRVVDALEPVGGVYVLVAEIVGDRARRRIEEALAASEIPARLLVWQSDEPGEHLAAAIDDFLEEITQARARAAAS